jgi:hypothetical protein
MLRLIRLTVPALSGAAALADDALLIAVVIMCLPMPVLEVSGTTTGITVDAADDDARADENVTPYAQIKF